MIRSLLFVFLATCFVNVSAEKLYKPYVLTAESTKSIKNLTTDIKAQLSLNKFSIVGSYHPMSDENRFVIIVNHPELTAAVKKEGGLTGFASTLRIGLIRENGKTQVSYTQPEYWCRAYFTNEYSQVESNILKVTAAFKATFKTIDGSKYETYGSENGLDADDLEDYNYMMGMPKFDDTEELAKYSSHKEAIATIEANFRKGTPNVKKVYAYKVPGKNIVVYGVALSGADGERNFIPKIDIATHKHVAFMPYEFIVVDNEVHMLHGRFRIALSFPDLTMGTFTKIMSTPGDIEDLIKSVATP